MLFETFYDFFFKKSIHKQKEKKDHRDADQNINSLLIGLKIK